MPKEETNSRSGAHAAHCCKDHGCKYCEPDCPVVNGITEQAYRCDECDQDQRVLDEAMRKAVSVGLIDDTPKNRDMLLQVIRAAEKIH